MSKRNPVTHIFYQESFTKKELADALKNFEEWFIEEISKRQMKNKGKLFSFLSSDKSLYFGDNQYMLQTFTSQLAFKNAPEQGDIKTDLIFPALNFAKEKCLDENLILDVKSTEGALAKTYVIFR